MTSLDLFPKKDFHGTEPAEWGTGKMKPKVVLRTPRTPTWHYTGIPTEQKYSLTQLKLSNVRDSDQLLPNPQHSHMEKLMINKPFPADHPFSSHQSRFAMFPRFAEAPEEAKRGTEARKQKPKNSEMPANPFDVIVLKKTKGHGLRHEIQKLPPESERKPLEWHSKTFDHIVKNPWGGQQEYYPIPPKTFVPNLEERSESQCLNGNMTVTPRTANAAKNLERDQWLTTYDLNHTGLGPSNPMELDNYVDKVSKYTRNIEDDSLYPREVRTFDPPRPFEGRIARDITSQAKPQTDYFENPSSNPDYVRKPTLREREEDRLLNGGKYKNLPEGNHDNARWKIIEDKAHPETQLDIIRTAQGYTDPDPYPPVVDVHPKEESYLSKMATDQHDKHQQMEAQNRWKLLESQKPHNDITALNNKMAYAVDQSQPGVFYDHEGTYQRERAGMYKTSYDPYTLQGAMNAKNTTGGVIFDISESHKDVLQSGYGLDEDMEALVRQNYRLGGPPGSIAKDQTIPSPYDVFGAFDLNKKYQTAALQPHSSTVDVRTQEGNLIQKESNYGDGYNTKKFLEENTLSFHGRNEPLNLMSDENQELNRVRATSAPKLTRQSSSVGSYGNGNEYPSKLSLMVGHSRSISPQQLPVPLEKGRMPVLRKVSDDMFKSKASNVMPNKLSHSWAPQSTYQQDNPSALYDIGFKNDSRFDWKVGCGTPRPHTSLLRIQDSFTKSNTRKKFHNLFSEKNPDLRENIISGKRHVFGSFNAQVLRGTPVIA